MQVFTLMSPSESASLRTCGRFPLLLLYLHANVGPLKVLASSHGNHIHESGPGRPSSDPAPIYQPKLTK
jgi:hypothetical protein